MKKLRDLKKGLSKLEVEGQGRGIIMGVTRLLLLGPFYYIALYWGGIKLCHTLYVICTFSFVTHTLSQFPFHLPRGKTDLGSGN